MSIPLTLLIVYLFLNILSLLIYLSLLSLEMTFPSGVIYPSNLIL